jgi:predicted aldo/keto reductase-like oxidoreductase
MKQLGFGFMRLPLKDANDQESVDMDTLNGMVDTFLERGFTYFDTAYMYHAFKSEIALREALVRRHDRNSFTVATKLPTMMLKTKEDQERIFDEQLEKTGAGYFDYYLLHNLTVENYRIAEEFGSFEFIARKKAEGKIRHMGFSFHDSADLLDRILTDHPETEFVQIQLNYLDWENPAIQSRKCYETARRHGKPVVVMEPVKGGMLANVPAKVSELFKSVRPEMSEASWAIRFAAGNEGVMAVLSGMSSMEQLLDNTSYMSSPETLSEKELSAVKEARGIINASIAIPCTGCQYCEKDCPKGIQISKQFALYNSEKQAPPSLFSLQKLYYGNLVKTSGKASDCVGCGNCERSCPQHLPIRKHLKDVASVFETM